MKNFDVDTFAEIHSYDLPNPFTSGEPKKRKAKINVEYVKKGSKPPPINEADEKRRRSAAIRAAASTAANRARKKKSND